MFGISMEKKSSTLRLIYPQWQGACIAGLVPEVKDPDEASRGYYLGAELLNFLAPDNGQEIRVVPISTKAGERKVCDGVMDRDIIALQTEAALDILRECNPDRIVTLGGECSVSVVPFTYLADKYEKRYSDGMDRRPPRYHIARRCLPGVSCDGGYGLYGIWR